MTVTCKLSMAPLSSYTAQFISHVVGDNTIKLQCMKNRERWLNIDDNDRLNVVMCVCVYFKHLARLPTGIICAQSLP